MQAFTGAPPFSQLPRGRSIKHLSQARKEARKLIHRGASLSIDLALQVNRQLPGLPPQNAGMCQNRFWVYSLGSLLLPPHIYVWILLLIYMSTILLGLPLPLTDWMLPIPYLLISALCLCHGALSVSSVFYVLVFYALHFHHFHTPSPSFNNPTLPSNSFHTHMHIYVYTQSPESI